MSYPPNVMPGSRVFVVPPPPAPQAKGAVVQTTTTTIQQNGNTTVVQQTTVTTTAAKAPAAVATALPMHGTPPVAFAPAPMHGRIAVRDDHNSRLPGPVYPAQLPAGVARNVTVVTPGGQVIPGQRK